MSDQYDITVDITSQHNDLKADFEKFKDLVYSICLKFGLKKASVGIAVVDDVKITAVNSQFLKEQNTTDVISFNLSDDDATTFELIVNADEAKRQAQKRSHSIEAELALYITHGMLHNLGFDDADRRQAEKMHKTEDDILQQAGFGIIYGCN
ncbi:MAG: rRNA maturation RNase YbeY [Sedimentisphaerales bacterium]|nr:rRNA maturation RNase YbeY [Sedimentisphaerales bacterium]